MITTLVKQPGEQLLAPVRFERPIAWPRPATVAARGLVAEAAPVVAGPPQVVDGGVRLLLSGGTDGERYLVTVAAETPGGELLEGEVELLVLDSTWATPDGGAPWLSIAGFIRRFTLDEVVRMTDPDGSGRIDRGLLVDALTDAQAIAEAHVAGRYALPFATVPRVIELAIADLARARLYPRGVPDAVDAAAKAALRLLEAIAAGRTTLGVPAADVPAAPASAAPVLIAPGCRHYPDGLADF
jgi:phage gp36-like protein